MTDLPITPTYPGVYIEELPSAVRTLIGVSTSVTAFVGRALSGPTNQATLIHCFADYERIFGGLWKKSNMSFAVYHYFQNGGNDAIIVRVAKDAITASFTSIKTQLKLKAANPGMWGEDLIIVIKAAETKNLAEDPTCFDLIVHQRTNDQNYVGPVLEMFQSVSLNPESPRYIGKLLVDGISTYLRVDGSIPSSDVPLPSDANYQSNHSASDGVSLDASTVIGNKETETGLHALNKVDIFNLLCIPAFDDADSTRKTVYEAALVLCQQRRAILIVDPQKDWDTVEKARDSFKEGEYVSKNENGVIYFPRIKSPNPLEEYRLREFDPCGAVAGVIVRTDGQRGVWKAPAGIEATLNGVPELTLQLTDGENGELNSIGINCLRIMPVAGRVIWGSRTLRGADSLADQWKYLPVRRMALYIEESLYRGTQWVVFESNDEKLWSQIRLNVGAFMQSLFIKGAFQGADPQKAYFVKCDSETTTQDVINQGIVNIIVGFAPLKPAEFVIIKIQQLAGQEP